MMSFTAGLVGMVLLITPTTSLAGTDIVSSEVLISWTVIVPLLMVVKVVIIKRPGRGGVWLGSTRTSPSQDGWPPVTLIFMIVAGGIICTSRVVLAR